MYMTPQKIHCQYIFRRKGSSGDDDDNYGDDVGDHGVDDDQHGHDEGDNGEDDDDYGDDGGDNGEDNNMHNIVLLHATQSSSAERIID